MKTRKLYDENSMTREFTAAVISCEELGEPRDDGAKYAVTLSATAFFPEGGGQTSDTGNLGSAVCSDVQERDGEILHYVDKALKPGSAVRGVLHWEERFRKMQNHTGEHLVSGIVHSQFGYDNVGFHLGTDGVTVDFNGVLTDEELRFVEYVANRAVGMNVAVTAGYPSARELADMDYRSKLDLTENVRIVTIEGFDRCACCAPHVTQTGAVGGVKILDSENWKGGVRVKMLCGLDAFDDYRGRLENTMLISNLLSCKQMECASAVGRMLTAEKNAREETARLKKALLDCKIAALKPSEDALVLFENDLDAPGVRALINEAVKLVPLCAVFCGGDENGWRYTVGSKSVALRAFAKELNAGLDGRGGGSDEMISGTVKCEKERIEAFFHKKSGPAC